MSVGRGGAPAAGFEIESLTAQRTTNGLPVVVADVHNTGGRALDMNGALHLDNGPGALRAGPYPATLGVSLAIGATEQVTILLDDSLPAGPWDAKLTLHSGILDRTAQATLTFPDTGAAETVPTDAAPPWLYFTGTVLLLLMLLLALRLWPSPAKGNGQVMGWS